MTALRPVEADDLPFLHRLTSDPGSTGEFQWYGFQNPHRMRERWDDNGMLGDDGGILIIADGGDPLGFVSWTRQIANRGCCGAAGSGPASGATACAA
ncbi:hypothetical protein GCM10022224_073540 [Nonomuraea antimicrobica]|uniref:Uncharacterized protein n=1 Tax=Nonomuraea antimicrobica TaxID=561173 RepID=A0ABP7D097_9ACTN